MQQADPRLGRPIMAPDERVQLLPDPAEVFADPQWAEYFFVLASVDLARIDSRRSGWLPIVVPIEPSVGAFNNPSRLSHAGMSLHQDWVLFGREKNGRYFVDGDPRFFALANEEYRPEFESVYGPVEKYYKQQRQEMTHTREVAQKNRRPLLPESAPATGT